jgi:hypothetical protein
MSAGSTHAGPLATAFHVQQERTISLSFIEPHNAIVRAAWNHMLYLYSEMLMVFLGILRGSAEPAAITAFEQNVRKWRVKAATITRQRHESPPDGRETGG